MAADLLGFDYEELFRSEAGYFLLNAISAFCGVPPNTVTCLAAGASHGAVWGTVLYMLSSLVGCVMTVLLVRFAIKDFVMRRMSGYKDTWAGLDKAIEKEGALYIVALLRLSPVMPLPVANAVLGLTSVGVAPYALGTFLGLFPCGSVYVYLGEIGQSAVAAASSDAEAGGLLDNPVQVVVTVVGIVATVVLTGKISKVAQAALDEAQKAGKED